MGELIPLRVEVIDRSVQSEKVVGVAQRIEELVQRVLDHIRAQPLRLPGGTRRVQVPAQRIRAVDVDQLPGVDHITLTLAHLDAIFIKSETRDDTVMVRRLPMDDGARGKERVEPATRLIHRFTDEVGGERFCEFLLVGKRVVPLRRVHRSRIEPSVDHVRHPVHRLAALRACQINLVDVRAVQFDALRQLLIEGTIHEIIAATDGDRLPTFLTDPQVERCSPVAIAGEGPILKISEEVSEPPGPHMRGIPVDRRVIGDHLILNRRCLHEPRVESVVEKRRVTTPAERIVVLI